MSDSTFSEMVKREEHARSARGNRFLCGGQGWTGPTVSLMRDFLEINKNRNVHTRQKSSFHILQGLAYRLEPKPIIKTPYKPESSCQVFGSIRSLSPPGSMGNRAVPEYLALLITLVINFVVFIA